MIKVNLGWWEGTGEVFERHVAVRVLLLECSMDGLELHDLLRRELLAERRCTHTRTHAHNGTA